MIYDLLDLKYYNITDIRERISVVAKLWAAHVFNRIVLRFNFAVMKSFHRPCVYILISMIHYDDWQQQQINLCK